MSNSIKIASVVVTFNRLELLKECIGSLREQTRRIDEIFVINNSSTDGTEEWLSKQEDLTTITQPNSGGAGGFYTGIKTAYEKGYDWIWVMDDDGLPKNNALEELTKFISDKIGVLNSIVVNKENEDELVFGLEDSITKIFYSKVTLISEREYIDGACFFNGTLISYDSITKVGFPNKAFFIYGDELEYFLRLKSNSIIIRTIISSVIKHPMQENILVGKGKYFYRINYLNRLGVKYVPRNLMALFYLYNEFTFRRLVKTYIYDLLGILFLQKNILFAFLYIKSIFAGIVFIKQLNKSKTNRH